MGRRGKVVFARIEDERKRKVSMKTRTAGLVKKVRELSILCDVEAAAVIYSPGDPHPIVWPSRSAATETISKYLKRPEVERKKRAHTSKSFKREKCQKLKRKAERMIKKNDERISQVLVTQIHEGKTSVQDLDSEEKKKICAFAEKKKEELLKHIRRLKRKEQQDLRSSQVLPPAVQKPPASQAVNILDRNGIEAGRNHQLPVAAYGQHRMNISGTTQLDPALHMNGLIAHQKYFTSPAAANPGQNMNLTAANRAHMTREFYRHASPGGVMQHPQPSPLSMPPNILTAYSARSLPYMSMTDYRLIISPRSGPPLSPPLDVLTHNSSSNTLNIEGLGRLKEQTNFAGMMQHSLALPLQLTSSGLDINNGLINAGTRSFTGDGDYRGMIQHAPPSCIPPQLPRHLSQRPMPPVLHHASGSNINGAENSTRSTIGFPAAASTELDLSDYGFDANGLDTDGFVGPPILPLDQRYFSDLPSEGEWGDDDEWVDDLV